MKRLLILLLLFPVVSADNYEIVGDSVQINDSKVFISVTPHTLNQSGYQNIALISKKYSGDIDIAFGFNSEDALPTSLDLKQGAQWNNIISSFDKVNYNFQGYDTWYVAKNLNVNAGQEYTARMYLNILPKISGSSGKYYIAIKPSSETIAEAVASGHFYYFDPWYALPTYRFRYEIFTNSTTTNNLPFSINDNLSINGNYLRSNNATTPEIRYLYSTGGGPIGALLIANTTAQVCWEYSPEPGVTGNCPTSVYPTDILGAWLFDDTTNANDSSSYNNDGTNGGASSITGIISTGLQFKGSEKDYINISSASDVNISNEDNYTIMAWVNVSDLDATDKIIFSLGNTTRNVPFVEVIYQSAGEIWGLHRDDVNALSIVKFTTPEIGAWYHVAYVRNGSDSFNLYINGTLVDTDDTSIGTTSINMATIGAIFIGSGTASNFFNGSVDEVYVFNRSLAGNSGREILEMYWNGINNLTQLGVEEVNQAPAITSATPIDSYTTTNTSAIINIIATDPDGDILNYYFWWNGTFIETNTNGTFNFTHDDLEKTNTWTVNVSDGINTNISTGTRDITIDYTNINLYELTTTDHITENLTIRLRTGNFSIIQSQDGNNVTFKNLDDRIGTVMVVSATNTSSSYFPVNLLSDSYTAGQDFNLYHVSSADNYALNTLKLQDLVGTFRNAQFQAWAYIGDVLTPIYEDIFDIEDKVAAYFDRDTRYTIYVQNDFETRNIGTYVPDVHGSTKIVTIGQVTFSPDATRMSDTVIWEYADTNDTIVFSWLDTSNGTGYVEFYVFNNTNISQQVYFANCTNTSICSFSYMVANVNLTYSSIFLAYGTEWGHSPFKKMTPHEFLTGFGSYRLDLDLPDDKVLWYPAFSMAIIIMFSMLFTRRHAGLGGVSSMGAAVFFAYIGWLPLPGLVVSVMLVMAVAHSIRKREEVR